MLFENAINCIANSISTLLFLPIWVNLMILLNKATPLIKSKRFTLNISLSVGLINILFSFACLICCLKNPQTIIGNNILWLDSEIQIYLGSLVDNLSATLLLFASLISFFIQLFAYKTIKEHPNYHRFYIYMNILNFSIFGLILSPNLIQTFIFSLFTSISCYLLSTFSQENPNEIKAKKLLVLDSFGNICFLCGLLNLIYFGLTFNSSQNIILLSYSNFIFEIDNLYSMLLSIDYTIISLLFITSIVIKLGQFPFFALLKTQTLPTLILNSITFLGLGLSGVYLLVRLYPIFILSQQILHLMLIIGIISAVVGVYFALSQNYFKKLITCVNISQFGIIFILLGLKAYTLSVFHFIILGLTSTLLGFIDVLLHENANIKNLFNIRKESPLLAILFGIGTLSICGLLFSGFYSNHFIFAKICEAENEWLTISYLLFTFLTAFCLARAYFLIFENTSPETKENIKIPTRQYIVCSILALIIAVFGVLFKSNFFEFIYFILPEKTQYLLTVHFIAQLFVIVCAIYICFNLYVLQNNLFMKIKENLLSKNNFIYKLSINCFYLDEICNFVSPKLIYPFYKAFDYIEKQIENLNNNIKLAINFVSCIVVRLQNNNSKTSFYYFIITLVLSMICIILFYIFGSLMEV